MGIGDWVNRIGDAVEDAAETVTARVGEAVDDVLDVGADGARALGLDSVAEALDDLGDQVSSALGGEVEERELGETDDPTELIRGEPSAITEAGTSLGKLSTAADQTGEGLRSVGVSEWKGLGADGFHVGFDPQPRKWTEASDAFSDAKAALEAWSSAVTAAQRLAADAITEWNAGVGERRRVLAWWRSLSDDQKSKATVTDTWSPRFQAARDILSRARTNRDTAAAQAVSALSAATALAPEEPPFTSRMAANVEDAKQIGDYALLSFEDGLLTGLTGMVKFVRQLNPLETYNLTHPAQYLENLSNLAGSLAVTAADPGPMVDAMIDDAKANPFETLGTLTANLVTSIPTGGAGLTTKAPALLSKVDHLAPSAHPAPHVPTRATTDLGRPAPDKSSPPSHARPETNSGVPQHNAPGPEGTPPREIDALAQDRGAGQAPDSGRPDANVDATHQDQPAPAREQPHGREHTDDSGGHVEMSGEQPHPSPESPTVRPEATPEAPPSPHANATPDTPVQTHDPATPATRPNPDPPNLRPDTYTPPTHPETNSPLGRGDTGSPAAHLTGDAPHAPSAHPEPDAAPGPHENGPAHTNSDTPGSERPPETTPDSQAKSPADTPRTDPAQPHAVDETPTRADTHTPEPVARADDPGVQNAPAHAQSGPVRDAAPSPTRATPDSPPVRPDGPTGGKPDTPRPAPHGPTSNPSPAPKTAPPNVSPTPRPHPDTTAPRPNLDAGPSTRPHPGTPEALSHENAPGTRGEPDGDPRPARDTEHERDTEHDHDGTDSRDHSNDEGGQPDSNSPANPHHDVADAANDPANTQTARDVAECGDPVDAATGEFLLPETDLTLPGLLPLVLTRRHRSNYRWGRWFGPTWSSTLDMRVVVDEQQVTFVGEDGLLLAYPHADPGLAVEPLVGGVRYTCVRTDTGTYRVADPEREIIWHFTPESGLDEQFGVYAITAITDRHLNRILFHYNADGAPSAITHTGGYRVEIATDSAIGRVAALAVIDATAVEDPADLADADARADRRETGTTVRRFAYAAGNLAAVTNGVGATTRYTYDDRDRMLSWTDSRGTSMVNTYDSAGRVILQHGTDGILNAGFDYLDYPDRTGSLTRHINSQGAVTTRGFDHDLRVRDIMDPLGGHTRIDYNPDRRPLQVIAPDNAVTRYAYSPDGDVTRIVRPDGLTIDIDYAWRNRPETITHPDGTCERREWDASGNLIATTDPGGSRTTFAYHAGGAVATITESDTARTSVTVNAAGLPITVTDPLGATTHIRRDGFGRPTAVTDPLGHITRYQWSPDGNLLRRDDPDGHRESWTYDGEGNPLTHTNRAGGVVQFTYGSWDLPISRTDHDGSTTRYTYDTERRLIAVTNPLGHTWHYRYDAAGRLTSETDYNGATTSYTHDPVGRVATVTPATGVARQHTYDILGRLTEITSDSGDWRRYTHDPLGRPLTATSGKGDEPIHTLDFAYTPTGQLRTQTLDAGTPMRFEYDPSGRRTLRTTPSGAQTHWRWDWCGRPTGLDTDGHTIGFTHNLAGHLTEWTIGELAITHTHDPLGRLQRQTVTGFPTRLSNLGVDTDQRPDPRQLRTDEFAWRPDGYITAHTTHTESATTHRDYQLDAVGRVTTLTRNGTLAEQYAYDPLNNITQSHIPVAPPTGLPGPAATPTATPPGTRREYRNNLLIHDGRTRYHYDESGRLIRKSTTRLSHKPDVWHYRYDAFDQLTDVWTPDHQWWHYTYDALGRRTTKQHLATDGIVLEHVDFIWDGTNLIGQIADTSTISWHYLPGTWTPITQTTNQTMVDHEFYAIITDFVGTPMELVETTSAISCSSASRNLWGHATWNSTADTNLRFPGQFWDAESGLHYNVFRTYDPETGRYLTQDPLGLAPAPNPSTYPRNPIVWSDPLGLAPYKVTVSPMAPDWATKGAHLHVGNMEVRIFPDHTGGVDVGPIRMAHGVPSDAQLRQALEAILSNPELRADLIAKSRAAITEMNSHGWGNAKNRAFELHLLVKALEKMG